MEYATAFDYAGNPLNGNPYSNDMLLTPSFFNASDFDFSNMLNFTPPIGNSQTTTANFPVNNPQTMLSNIQGDLRQSRTDMPGDFVSGSEYPFPNLTNSMSNFTLVPEETLVPAARLVTANSGFLADALPRTVLPQGQSELQSVTVQAQRETERQESGLAPSAPPAGQKRATTNPENGEEPKPKRRRGARKKVRTAEELAIKRENHLQRNRDAAQKCRQKKKLTEAQKKDQMSKERQDNHIVWTKVASVQDELESFQNLALEIESTCLSNEYKTLARTGLETIMKTAAKLQTQIDMCNERRAQISPELVMQKSYGGYVQQGSLPDGPESMQDGQSPGMSPPQSSAYHSENLSMARPDSYAEVTTDGQSKQMSPGSSGMGSHVMTRADSYAAHKIDTDVANDVNMSRKGSSASSKQPDSAVDFNSPPGSKKYSPPVEDEAIDNSAYPPEIFRSSRESIEGADAVFALLTHLQHDSGNN
ncbi:hypothetical protein BKA65DRAFT_552271 [Rhexocercosporidium sp. MPI-PUGE-AT-0058]|nr:hypothetical protein BKA65DRAFT_552271 [Rhexocercosporidium sp. MPI-PUGE-AT-0058]